MADLVVGERPGPAGGEVEDLPLGRVPHREQAGLAEDAVGVDRVRHRADPVFAGDQHREVVPTHDSGEIVDQRADLGVEFAARGKGRRAVGPSALGGVVEVREVDDGTVGRCGPRGLDKTPGDPPRRLDARDRPPELVERKLAKFLPKCCVERLGIGMAPHRLAAVGVVLRRRQADEICRGMLRLEQKPGCRPQVWAGRLEPLPDPRRAVHRVGADPHLQVVRAPVEEPVGEDAVRGGPDARGERRLHGAGDSRETGGQGNAPADGSKPRQHRHPREVLDPQARNRKQQYVHKRCQPPNLENLKKNTLPRLARFGG